jgi:hypothetical protein
MPQITLDINILVNFIFCEFDFWREVRMNDQGAAGVSEAVVGNHYYKYIFTFL